MTAEDLGVGCISLMVACDHTFHFIGCDNLEYVTLFCLVLCNLKYSQPFLTVFGNIMVDSTLLIPNWKSALLQHSKNTSKISKQKTKLSTGSKDSDSEKLQAIKRLKVVVFF